MKDAVTKKYSEKLKNIDWGSKIKFRRTPVKTDRKILVKDSKSLVKVCVFYTDVLLNSYLIFVV